MFHLGFKPLRAALLCTPLVGVLACSLDSDAPRTEAATDGLARDSVGAFRITVDARAAQPVTVERLFGNLPQYRLQSTSEHSAGNTVLDSVDLTGPGVWDDATQTLSANVVITHTDSGSGDFDELQLVVTDLSDPTVTFETSDSGSQGVGAVMAFSDIQSPASTPKCSSVPASQSARHSLVIRDTDPTTTFSFTVDVRAVQGAPAAGVLPDCDSDGFNTELSQDAGDDCNDGNSSIQAGCTCTAGPDTCTAPGGTCTQTGGGSTTCNGGCTCDVDGSGEDDTAVTCTQDCDVTCDNPQDGGDGNSTACSTTCSGSTTECNLDCTNATDGSCVSTCGTGATCDLDCENNSEACYHFSCGSGSNCSTTCEGNNGGCGVLFCSGGSDCDVSCSGDFDSCGITFCSGGSTSCNVTCGPGLGTEDTCSLGCVLGASCTMDCSAIPVAERNTVCDLTCGSRDRTETSPGSGIFFCD